MLKIALAQMNAVVGDLAGNARMIADYAARARRAKADLVVFPELALCGYPPEDLLFKKHFVANTVKALDALVKKTTGIAAIVGFVDTDGAGRIYNAAAFITDGTLKGVYRKRELPNYGVFDERRYFTPGTDEGIFTLGGTVIAVNICEDIWVDKGVYAAQAKRKPACSAGRPAVMINISSSPYETGKPRVREALLRRRVRETKIPMVYVNMVGGQDELVFDGASMVIAGNGKVAARAKQFGEDLLLTDCAKTAQGVLPLMDENEEIYNALVMGTRDYVRKNGFSKVAVGLSGGLDSALVAVIAVDALGKDNVIGISMPSPFNVKATRADAIRLARNLGIEFKEIPIKTVFASYLKALKGHFSGPAGGDTAEENLQARIRGNLLMAFSNKFGWLVLTTGNKSEMAVGYCTLYGDMSGGFAVLKDIFKTRVYELARWRNIRSGESIIPKSVVLRAPSAELRPGQTDEQALGAYADLDRVLSAYVEDHRSVQGIAGTGLPLKYVQRTARLVDSNEYKRRQAPPGVKITSRAFGKDWRLPITNRYRE